MDSKLPNRDRIAIAIRDSLDIIGIELDWKAIYEAAKAVEEEFEQEWEDLYWYNDLRNS